jgi:S1-C subfamily serine protease
MPRGWELVLLFALLVLFAYILRRLYEIVNIVIRKRHFVLPGVAPLITREMPRTTTPLITRTLAAPALWRLKRHAVAALTIEITPGRFAVGTAFFVTPAGYLVTAAHCVLNLQAGMVEADKSTGFCRNKRKIQSEIPLVHAVTATVTNFNGVAGDNRVIGCEVVAVHGLADIALLRVPGLTKQTFIAWNRKSRMVYPGTDTVVIGNTLGLGIQQCTHGVVRNQMYFDPGGEQPIESVIADASTYAGNSGSPILQTQTGLCLGILTFGLDGSPGMGGGVASQMASVIVDRMIAQDRFSAQHGIVAETPDPDLETAKTDRRGSSLTRGTRGTRETRPGPAKAARATETGTAAPAGVDSPRGPTKPANPAKPANPPTYSPGLQPMVANGACGIIWRAYTALERERLGNLDVSIAGAVVSERWDDTIWPAVLVNDIVTHINDVAIGSLPGQVPPSSVTLLCKPGDTVRLVVRRGKPNSPWERIDLVQIIGSFSEHMGLLGPLNFVT